MGFFLQGGFGEIVCIIGAFHKMCVVRKCRKHKHGSIARVLCIFFTYQPILFCFLYMCLASEMENRVIRCRNILLKSLKTQQQMLIVSHSCWRQETCQAGEYLRGCFTISESCISDQMKAEGTGICLHSHCKPICTCR